eukprot:scaffold18016_cov65-Phaeocystis_antarctica.AAC.3
MYRECPCASRSSNHASGTTAATAAMAEGRAGSLIDRSSFRRCRFSVRICACSSATRQSRAAHRSAAVAASSRGAESASGSSGRGRGKECAISPTSPGNGPRRLRVTSRPISGTVLSSAIRCLYPSACCDGDWWETRGRLLVSAPRSWCWPA